MHYVTKLSPVMGTWTHHHRRLIMLIILTKMKHSGIVGVLKFAHIVLGVFLLSLAINAYCQVWKELGALILLSVSLANSSAWFIVFFICGTSRLRFKLVHFMNHMLGMLAHEIVAACLLASAIADIGPNRHGQYGHCVRSSRNYWLKIVAASVSGLNCILHGITAHLFSQTIPSEVVNVPVAVAM